ncbi:MAG: autotransporter outer membrane beta-barrel domain-containing protein, partial [Terrimicrobiaceae bacterium]
VNAGTLIMNGGSYRANEDDGKAIVITNARAELNNASLTTTGNDSPAAYVGSGGQMILTNATLTTGVAGDPTQGVSSYGIIIDGGAASVTAANVDIVTNGNGARGINQAQLSDLALSGVRVTTHGANATGLSVYNGDSFSTLGYEVRTTGENVSIVTTGAGARGLYVSGTPPDQDPAIDSLGYVDLSLSNSTIATSGDSSTGVYAQGQYVTATLSNVGITTSGAGAHGAHVQVGGTLKLIDSTIAVTGPGANAIFTTLGTAANPNEITVTRGSLSSAQADLIQATNAHSNITLNALTASSSLGNLLLNINSSSTVNFVANGSTLTGDTLIQGGSTANITANSSVWTGNILTDETSTAQINLVANSVLTGMIDPASLAVDGTSTWNVTADSILSNIDVSAGGKVLFLPPAPGFKKITITGNLTGSGLFGMNTNLAALRGDHIDVQGTSAGSHSVLIANTGGTPTGPGQALEIVSTADGAANFALANPGQRVDAGMYSYRLRRGNNAGNTPDPTNWYLVNDYVPNGGGGGGGGDDDDDSGTGGSSSSGGGGPGPGSSRYPALSPVGRAIVSSGTGVIGTFWLTQFDMLHKRMGDLRLNNSTGTTRSETKSRTDVWVRGYGQQIKADTLMSGGPFDEYVWGIDAGVDKGFRVGDGWLYAGGYGGYGQAQRQFSASSNGSTEAIYGGLYGTYIWDQGWYLDAVGKVSALNSDCDAIDSLGQGSSGDFNNWGFGFSLEGGRQFGLKNGWFVEPQVQMAYAHITGTSYTSTNDINVQLEGDNLWQFKIGTMAGKKMKFAGSILQPFVKAYFVEAVSSGGNVRAQGGEWRPNLDGPRVEAGAGAMYAINRSSQLYADYEFAAGEKYIKPWAVNVGFRYEW